MPVNDLYAGILQQPGNRDMERIRTGRLASLQYFPVDLTNARSLANGTAQVVNIAGNFFYTDSDPVNQGGIIVHFQEVSQGVNPAAGIYMPPGAVWKTPFTQLLIENAAQPGKRALIVYGTDVDADPGGSNQVTVTGIVSVVDGGKTATLAEQAFLGSVGNNGLAANYAFAQLFNPVGSGYRAVVSALRVRVVAAGLVSFGIENTRRPTLVANGVNKLSGAPASLSELRTETTVANTLSSMETLYVAANSFIPYVFKEPIVLLPGYGLSVHGALGNDVVASYEWTEEQNV